MQNSFVKRFVSVTLSMLILSFTFAENVSALSPVFPEYEKYINVGTLSVNNYPFSYENAYIAMYEVTPVRNGRYEGKLVSIKKQKNGVAPFFNVKEGKIVDFVAFQSQKNAQRAKKWSFTTSPYRNFSDGDFCRINNLNSNQKLWNNGLSCNVSSLQVKYADSYIGYAQGANTLSVSAVSTFEAWPQETEDPTSLVKNAVVKLYDEYGRMISLVNTGERGVATFVIKKGNRFYVEAEKDGKKYGGRMKVYYPNQTAIYYLSRNGKQLVDAYTGSSTYSTFLQMYPQTGTIYPPVSYNSVPVITSPTENQSLPLVGSGQTSTRLEWQSVYGATSYTMDWQVYNCESTCGWHNLVSGTSAASNIAYSPIIQPQRTYRFRVRAVFNTGASFGEWSSYRTFSYGYGSVNPVQPLSIPTIRTPLNNYQYPNNGSYQSSYIEWNNVQGAAYYELEWNTMCASCSSWQTSISIQNSNYYTTTFGLSAGYRYFVRVRTVDSSGNRGAWSTGVYFSMPQRSST